jgi:membrane fusion protein (multidrug efflux system)
MVATPNTLTLAILYQTKMKSFLLILFISLFFLACQNEDKSTTSNGKGLKAATLVEVIVVQEKALVEQISTTGNLMANESTELSTEVGGMVESINFDEGQAVKKGNLLLSLKNQDLQARLKEVEAEKELAKKKLLRNQELFKAKGISEEVLDEARTTHERLKANYASLQAELEKTKVYAPFDGFVGLRNTSIGDYLGPNTSFATLVDYKPIKIGFSLPEKYAAVLKLGDSISFESASLSTTKQAVVYAIEPQVSEDSRTLSAKAIYPNENGALLPGSFVTISYEIEQFEKSIVIPNQAIIPELEGKKVFLIKNGKVSAQSVVSGIRRAEEIQIIEGLQVGDTLVTSGLLQIRDGIPVRIRIDESYGNQSSGGE